MRGFLGDIPDSPVIRGCNLLNSLATWQIVATSSALRGGSNIYIYMYIHNIKCDIFVDSPAYEFLLHVHIDSKGTCCQLPPEAFHAVLDGLSNADKKKFLMFVTGIEAYGLLQYKAGAYPSYNRALLDLYESNEFK